MTLELETRNDPNSTDDNLDDATRAVNELRAASEEHRARLDERLATETRALNERIATLETRLSRPHAQPRDPNAPSLERRAFVEYLRHGDRAAPNELRSLIVSSDPSGGYFTPPELSSEFIRELVLISPIRPLASVRTTASEVVTYPTRTGITNATWKGETQAMTGSQPTFGQTDVPLREINTFVDISKNLLADSAGVADREVTLALSQDFGQKEALAFVKGAGPLQPEGIIVNSRVGYTPTGNASALPTGAALSDLMTAHFYSVPAPYRQKGTWLMNSTTLAAIRTIKDATGRYIWQPALSADAPETILGRPVEEIYDMDSAGAGTSPIVFGDIATAYRIIDRASLSILVDPYSQAASGLTRIYSTRRVGGGVIQPAAIKKITCATA